MESFLRDINYMIYIRYIYHSYDTITYCEDECGIHMFDETTHCSLYFTYDKVVEFKKEEEPCYYLHFEFINMHSAMSFFNDFLSYLKKLEVKHVLICCSSAMTSSYFCEVLNSYCKNHNEHIVFHCSSYLMIDLLQHKYDYVLLAPQVGYKKIDYIHIPKLDVISTNDYATYNVSKIIEFVKKKVKK